MLLFIVICCGTCSWGYRGFLRQRTSQRLRCANQDRWLGARRREMTTTMIRSRQKQRRNQIFVNSELHQRQLKAELSSVLCHDETSTNNLSFKSLLELNSAGPCLMSVPRRVLTRDWVHSEVKISASDHHSDGDETHQLSRVKIATSSRHDLTISISLPSSTCFGS